MHFNTMNEMCQRLCSSYLVLSKTFIQIPVRMTMQRTEITYLLSSMLIPMYIEEKTRGYIKYI